MNDSAELVQCRLDWKKTIIEVVRVNNGYTIQPRISQPSERFIVEDMKDKRKMWIKIAQKAQELFEGVETPCSIEDALAYQRGRMAEPEPDIEFEGRVVLQNASNQAIN